MPLPRSLRRRLPFLEWIPNYRREDLGGDLVAGLTVAVMLIPQGMAYAMLAGLPPIVGLYASIVPLLIYGLLGTSRQLAVGPVAMVSLMVASGVGALAESGTDAYLSLAIALALMVGVMQGGMGLAKIGFVVRFLSHPVIAGFTSAAALIIAFSQLKHLLGVPLPSSHHLHEILFEAFAHIDAWSWPTVAMGLIAIAVLVTLKRLAPRVPGALVVVAVGTLVVWAFGLEELGIATVGEVPSGLPAPTLPTVSIEQLGALLPTALAISLVGFMESISVAKAFANRNNYKVDPDQELVALGAANVASAFFGGYSVTGGFSRTAINGQAGARSGLASLITAVAIAVALLTITPLFAWLPNAVLAAIVISAVVGLIDVTEAVHLWRIRRADLAQLVVTFIATLALGIEIGIGTGVAFSLLQVIWASARPVIAELGRVPGGPFWRDLSSDPALEAVPDVVVLRLDARLYFANVGKLEQLIEARVAASPCDVVLDCTAMNDIDSSAVAVLLSLSGHLSTEGRSLALADVKSAVERQLVRGGLFDVVRVFATVEDAVRSVADLEQPPFDVSATAEAT